MDWRKEKITKLQWLLLALLILAIGYAETLFELIF